MGLGLSILPIAVLFNPAPLNTGASSSLGISFVCAAGLIGIWILTTLLSGESLNIVPFRPITAILAFSSATILSFIIGLYPWYPIPGAPMRAQVGQLAIFLVSAGTFLLVVYNIKNIEVLRTVVFLFLAVGSLVVLSYLLPPLESFLQPLVDFRTIGSLFWIWYVALAFGQAAFNRDLHLGYRLFLVLAVLSAFVHLLGFNAAWISGWFPALIALGIVAFFRFPRTVFCSGLIMVAVLPIIFGRIYEMILSTDSYSLMTRIEAWKIMASIIESNPIFGVGPANYYYYTVLYPILGWNVSFNSHNNYVDIIAQTGFLGFFCLLWVFYESGRTGLKLYPQMKSGFTRAYVAGSLGGLVATVFAGMLGDWFLPFVYNVGVRGFRTSVLVWLFLGGLVMLERTVKIQDGAFNGNHNSPK
jgi:O-antigen ligase